jgi:pimeloyl-ACP methyl ester carboxylesterase
VTDDSDTNALRLLTNDGLSLEAEIRLPSNAPSAPDTVSGAVVLAHPHPQQGGSMASLVTSELFRLLPTRGLGVLRFNFRGVGSSEGSYGEGRAERADIEAAIDASPDKIAYAPAEELLAAWDMDGDGKVTAQDVITFQQLNTLTSPTP